MDKIYIIEDDLKLSDITKEYLENNGYDVSQTESFINIMKEIIEIKPNLIILDINLPYFDGYYICREIRRSLNIPIIITSARSGDMDQILAVDLGADDYITKPFSPSELVARVKAHLSRYERLIGNNENKSEEIKTGGLRIDRTARRVYVNEKEVPFTTKEFELLTFLAMNPNHVFSKEELFDKLWGMDAYGDIATVTVHVRKVR